MLLLVLRGRGLAVSTTHEAQILATRDLARLEAWTQRALTASTTDDALAD
jgi:hypothetical protein